jgi:hypothetical protein
MNASSSLCLFASLRPCVFALNSGILQRTATPIARHSDRARRGNAGSPLSSTEQLDHDGPKAGELTLERAVLLPQAHLCFPRPDDLVFLRPHEAVQMAHLDELRPIEMKALDVEPAARSEPEEPAVGRLGDVHVHVVALGAKKPQALRCIAGWRVVAFEAITGRASVDEVLYRVGASRGLRVKVVDLELTAHGYLGHAAVAAPAAEGHPHGRARLGRDCHLRRRQWAAREPGKPVEDGGATLLEFDEKATRVRGKGLLLREQAGQLLVLALKSAELVLQLAHLGAQAVHRRGESMRLLGLDLGHKGRELHLLGLRERAGELFVAEVIQPGLTVVCPAHGGAVDV